ncbi:hypothetical protein [Xanthomonas cannabis]|uniref:Endonuclease/exonuclease/phosphatase domain-containing protein n=1 Tax=Xanthomonas cannabis TaxID=1885674 RepID=A0ABR6JGR9_9XANT|nr:hypothetical protein [Xanthomonas cannabis]MBB4591996.1 hypothetical protein [Xanthomonas cannabis]MBB5522023.1 hypothetical protein [Xanthomonas cannabis]
MKIIAWNSQGAKWNQAWNHYVAPLLKQMPLDDIALFLVEAGWAPWVESGDVVAYMDHPHDSARTYYDSIAAAASDFCAAITRKRLYKATWVPWVSGKSEITNTRCSLGSAFFPHKYVYMGTFCKEIEGFIRPIIYLRYGVGITPTVKFTIYNTHMISRKEKKAAKQLTDMMKMIPKEIPEKTSAMIIGDMNVNLQIPGHLLTDLPLGWRIVKTGVPTQKKGGELDFGLLYDPLGHLEKSTAQVVEKFETGNNHSDHSVILYNIPLA